MGFFAPKKCRAQCYASLHSNFHKHLRSHDAGKACHSEGYIRQTINLLRIYVYKLSLHIVWHDLFAFQM